jgi:hypothetical protein
MLERLAQNARLKRRNVGGDVRKFRHCIQIAGIVPDVARRFLGFLN